MKVLHSRIGTVYLVGAGPGAPDLLTLKGARLLAEAEVVVHDRLVDSRILELAPQGAERIAVGKKGGHYCFPQEAIHRLLVQRAREGKTVVRLKGGDPFLFGRGGEEALHLKERGIPFEIVPGVSSALAVPAAAGIPVTYRDLSSSVTIVTGHQANGSECPVRWDRLAAVGGTLVVLMPLSNLRRIVAQLVLHGRSLDTPCAVVQSGTLERQQEVVATLGTVAAEVASAGLGSPSLLVIGEVVKMAGELARLRESLPQLQEAEEHATAAPL